MCVYTICINTMYMYCTYSCVYEHASVNDIQVLLSRVYYVMCVCVCVSLCTHAITMIDLLPTNRDQHQATTSGTVGESPEESFLHEDTV